ncbi:MAG: adenosylcobinamide-GDP ribazoletransferase [Kiloniellaceae bacterium]
MISPTTATAMRRAADLSLWWTDLMAALGMLTRLPVARAAPLRGADPARAGRAMPLVGALVGLTGAAAYAIADAAGLPAALSGLVAVAATILLTGAFHEDGLADVADGFGGAFDRARKLEIMRASGIGAFGALALVLSVALRAGALAALAEPGAVAAALVAAHAVARAALPAVMAAVPLARPDGLAATLGRPQPGVAAAALLIGAVIALPLLGLGGGVLALVAAGIGAAILVSIARAQIGGYSGDVLGAVEQVAEVAVLLVAAAGT